MIDIRPRRSALYMPASNAKAVAKARTLPCDVVILDLEDAVAPDAKAAARDAAAAAVREGGFGRREVVVRVNALSSRWGADDCTAVANVRPDAVLLPKVDDARSVAAYRERLGSVPVWAMVETARAVLRLDDLASAPGLTALVVGINDIAKELRMVAGDGPAAVPRLSREHRGGGTEPWPRGARRGLQRHRRRRGVRRGMRAGPPLRLRREDADPSKPGRAVQCGVQPCGRRDRLGANRRRRVRHRRCAQKGGDQDRGEDGRAASSRPGAANVGHCRGDRQLSARRQPLRQAGDASLRYRWPHLRRAASICQLHTSWSPWCPDRPGRREREQLRLKRCGRATLAPLRVLGVACGE